MSRQMSFVRYLPKPSVVLPPEEVAAVVMKGPKAKWYCIAGTLDKERNTLTLIAGDWSVIEVDLEFFNPSGNSTPDFDDFSIVDGGDGLRFGDYEASFDALLP